MRRVWLSRAAIAWLSVRATLAIAAVIAASVQGGAAVGLGLAATIVVVRPLRRGWVAAIPIGAVALASPVAACLLAGRALFTEAFLWWAGARSLDRLRRDRWGGRRARGLTVIHDARRALMRDLGVPAAPSIEEANERYASERTSAPGSRGMPEATIALATTLWVECRPWTLARRAPEIVLAFLAAEFEDDEEAEFGTGASLALGVLIEEFGTRVIAFLLVFPATLIGALAFPASPVSVGPVSFSGSLAQALAVFVLGMGVATRSGGTLVLGAIVAVALASSEIVATVAITAIVGAAAAASTAVVNRLVLIGAGPRGLRDPYRGPWRLRGLWRAATSAAAAGRLTIAIRLLEQLLVSQACTEDLRARAQARLALYFYDSGRLDRAAALLPDVAAAGALRPEVLSAAGAVAAGLGDLETAERLLREALSSLPRRSPLRSRATLALAEVCSRRGRPDEAIALIRVERANPWSYGGVARLYESEALIAAALVRKGDLERAARRLADVIGSGMIDSPEATRLSAELRRDLVQADGRARLVAGEAALGQSSFSDAEELLKSALGRLDGRREPHLHACARALYGVALTLRGRTADGLAETNAGVRRLEARRTQLRRADHRTGLILAEADLYGWCFEAFDCAARAGSAEAAESAAWLIESLRKSALSQMLRDGGIELPRAAGRLIEQIDRLERSINEETRGRFRSGTAAEGDLDTEIGSARTELASALSDEFAEAYVPAPTSIDALRSAAQRCGDILTFYLPGGELPGWRVWLRPDGTFQLARVEVSDREGSELLARLGSRDPASVAALHAPIGSSATAAWTSLAEALLPAELTAAVEGGHAQDEARSLLIAPDGVLGVLPWSALLLADGSPLGTRAAIQVIPALGVTDADREIVEALTQGRATLAHLDPSMDGHASELHVLDRHLALTLTHSRTEFVAALQRRVHEGAYLAAHGQGLGLEQSVNLGDGLMSAGSALAIPWPQWTLFASCLVGRVPKQTGQEPLGLPISCVLAGSRSVLAAVVEIPSDTVPQLIEPLVSALAQGEHPAQALARAQRLYLAANPHASVAECLGFVCLTRSPLRRESVVDLPDSRHATWQDTVREAWAAAEHDPDRARSIFLRGIEADPHPSLLVRYADFLTDEGDDPQEAARIVERAIETDPQHVEARQMHAWLLLSHGEDATRTREAFQHLLELDPENRWGIPPFARFLRDNTTEDQLAAHYYRRALEIDPDEADHAAGYGIVLERMGDLDGARDMYERALAQEPNRVSTSARLARVLARTTQDRERIARLYERAIRLDPGLVASGFNAWALVTSEDLDDRELARQILERGRRAAPDDPYLAINLAWVLFEAGETDLGSELTAQAMSLTNDSAVHLEGWFYRAAFGDGAGFPEARGYVERLLEEGVRSEGWDLSRIVERVRQVGHEDLPWVEQTAQRISGPVRTATGP